MINPLKDVDCLTVSNRSKVIEQIRPELMPCTPLGVMKILEEHQVDLSGKIVIVAGQRSLVGLPLFHMLHNRNATITLCNSKTEGLNKLTAEADVVISAVGKPNLITQLKPGAVAIDVGVSRVAGGKLCGDICEDAKKQSFLGTPVPGGVGPLTASMMMHNTANLWMRRM
jgi:methylenetetrahydrofolate dehydrogenase (NADP+) / methenyltetrahydrofolate cyclohydrolase